MFKSKRYYSLDRIKEKNATYNMIFGQRSNGKTYAALKEGLLNYAKNGEQLAIIRRWKEDFIGKRGVQMFAALVDNREIEKVTSGAYTTVAYYASKWYLARYDKDEKLIKAEEPFAYGFALSDMEHDKSTAYPKITTIVFDEFISRMGYLHDEFIIFLNVISTIIRDRKDVHIYMLGNTVNKYCPYFEEMGLKHIKKMNPGDIDVYTYGSSALTVAVEYAEVMKKDKKKDNDYYFAFDNPKLQMITGGAWEIDIYPHLPIKYKPKDVLFNYFIQFAGSTLHCEVIYSNGVCFTYIHEKSTPIKDPDQDIIYSPEAQAGYNYRRNILRPSDGIDKRIYDFFKRYKVFYQSNEIGEVVRNYLLWCNNRN